MKLNVYGERCSSEQTNLFECLKELVFVALIYLVKTLKKIKRNFTFLESQITLILMLIIFSNNIKHFKMKRLYQLIHDWILLVTVVRAVNIHPPAENRKDWWNSITF